MSVKEFYCKGLGKYNIPMSLSIIIPVLNEVNVLQQSLQFLQTIRNNNPNMVFEVIVVDGGSDDGTLKSIQVDNSLLVDIVVHSDMGRSCQMNEGAKYASYSTLVFLHADTCLFKDVLQSIIQSNQSWGFCSIQLRPASFLIDLISAMINWRSKFSKVATGDQVIWVSNTLFQQVGGYDDIPIMEDVALCKKLRAVSVPDVIRTKVESASRRWQRHGVVRTVLLMWLLRFAYFCGIAPNRLAKMYHHVR